MSPGKSGPAPIEKSAKYQERIAELESELAQLRAERSVASAAGPSLPGSMPLPGSVLESITDAFYALDGQFRFIWVNVAAERILSHARGQLLGDVIWDRFPHLIGTNMEHECRKALAEKTPVEFEYLCGTTNHWFWHKAYPTAEGGLAIYWRDITDQKRAQAELRRHALILKQVHDSIMETDLKGRITDWNHGAELITGYEAHEVVGKHISFLCFEEDRDAVRSRMMDALAQTGELELELRNQHKRGHEVHIHLSVSLVRDEAGQPYGTVGIATDITARKNTENALRNSEERFRLAVQAVEGIVYDWDVRTDIVDRTGNLAAIIGVPTDQAEATREWWTSRIHPEDRAAREHAFGLLDPERSSFESTYRVRHADGHWVHVCDRGSIVRDETGAALRVVGSKFDDSARKRLEQELKFQAGILATTTDAVIALGPDHRIRYCNAAAERMYGVASAEVLGKPLSTIGSFGLPAQGMPKGEGVHVRKDGKQLYVSSSVNVLSPEMGGGVMAVIRDIGEQKRAEREIQNQAAQLARANEDLLHFAYAVSHDLQAPLRTVGSFSQLLALEYTNRLDDRAHKFIKWIVESNSRMTAMLTDLLRFAQVAGGELLLREQVSLEEALAGAIQNLGSAVAHTGATITHGPLPEVAADAGQLTQLFQNLIGNSLTYRKPEVPPQIHVSAAREGDGWVISVEDNGIGFDSAQAEKIFGVFKRLHQNEYPGTGIGLAICKRIVERRGGRVWAVSTAGEGATFSFSIPDEPAAVRPLLEIVRNDIGRNHEPNEFAPPEQAASPRHLDELFQMLDLVQAILRRLDGTIAVWPRGAERLFGWTKAEAVGRLSEDVLKTEFPQPLSEIRMEVLRDGEWKGELKRQTRDGRVVWCASHFVLYRDGSGRPQSVIEVYNDITALKNAELDLLHSSSQRDLALRAGRMGTWEWDCRTGVVQWAETIETMLGMAPGSFERTYEAFVERVHPEDRALVAERIADAFGKNPEYEVQFRIRRADGDYAWQRGQGRVLFDEQNAPKDIIGVVWDVTASKQAEQALQASWQRQELMLDLLEGQRKTFDADAMMRAASESVGRHLQVDRVGFLEMCGDDMDFRVGWTAGRLPLLAGAMPAHGIGTRYLARVRAGMTLGIDDARIDPLTADSILSEIGTVALIGVPIIRNRRWHAGFYVNHSEARHWTDDEIALVRDIGEMTWDAVERARAVTALRKSESG